MKLDRLMRLLSIVEIIRKQPGVNFYTLAEEFGVTERTIRRDIDLLEKAGFPLQNYRGLRFLTDVDIPKFELEPDEVLILLLIVNSLSKYKFDKKRIQKITSKLKKHIPEKMLQECNNMAEQISILPGVGYKNGEEIINTLVDVLKSRHKVKILYNSFSSKSRKWRTVEPYGIFFKRRAWYLIAYCYLRGKVRIFRCNRIEEIKHLRDSYKIPADFKIEKFLADSWELMQGEPAGIKVRFSKEVAPLIMETEFHRKESKKEMEGDIIYEIEVANWKEVYFWILSFGANAEIIEPAWLREKCREELEKMSALYRK